MLKTLFRRQDRSAPGEPIIGGLPARVPPGVCVYAIGDIHGRADLLTAIHERIAEDAMHLTPGTDRVVVYVGDYVDRGLDSKQVIDILITEPLPEFRTVHLLGNHDAWLLSFLLNHKVGPAWLRYGGDVTLHSYGVWLGLADDDPHYFEQLQAALRSRLPRAHLEFLRRLELSFEIGDYLFVHAGVNPGLPLEQQRADDLLWIREPFLSSKREYGKIIVHGHTVEAEPVIRSNRIGIDTGACWTGRLTCLVLEEGTRRFLATGRPGDGTAGDAVGTTLIPERAVRWLR